MRSINSRLIWDLYALAYDTISNSVSYKQLLTQVIEKLDLKPGQKLLDLGCGTGNLESRLDKQKTPNLEITALDLSARMLAQAKKKLSSAIQVRFIQADISAGLNFPDQSFDRVVMIHTLYFVAHPTKLIHEIARVLKREGCLVLAEPKVNAQISQIFAENFKELGLFKTTIRMLFNLPALVWNLTLNLLHLKKLIQENQSRLSYDKLIRQMRLNDLHLMEKNSSYAGQSLILVIEKR